MRSQMTQWKVLRGEEGARAWRESSQMRKGMWASAGGARHLGDSACVVKPTKVLFWLWGQFSLLWCSPRGSCAGRSSLCV